MIPGLFDSISGAVQGLFGKDGLSGLVDNITTTKEEKLQAQAKLEEIKSTFQTKAQELLIEQAKLQEAHFKAEMDEMANARNREIQIATSEKAPLINKIIQPILALLLLGSCFAIWYTIIFKEIPKEKEVMVAGIIGSLTTIAMGVIAYYFGSSSGSKAKSDQLNTMMNK